MGAAEPLRGASALTTDGMPTMHDVHDFLTNLTLVLGVAAVTTIVFQRLRQPVVFGYMLAGLIVGPYLPIPLVADPATVRTLSELGVILVMFSLGLEFSLRRLLSTGWTVLVVAVLECSLMLWLGYVAGRLLGWTVLESLFVGAAVAISSTTIIVKAFADRDVGGGVKNLVFGILVVEDLIAILLLALLTPAASGQTASPAAFAVTGLRLVAVLIGLMVIGMLIVPRLVRYVVALRRPETTLVACVGLCFAMALLAQAIGYSVALGAFLAGSLVAESGKARVVERLVEPIRDMFAAIFFVSVGMMIDPSLVATHWVAVLVLTGLVIAGKIAAVSTSAFLTGNGIRTAVQAGMSMAQIGEFSFIIAGVGLASGAISPSLYPIVVAVSALTTLTTPWLIRLADPAAAFADRNLPRPFQTFVALYGSWIENIYARPETRDDRARLNRTIRVLMVDAAVIAALAFAAALVGTTLGDRLAARFGISSFAGRAAVVSGAFLLSVPFLVGIGRTGRALGQMLSRRAFVDPEPNKLDLAAAPRRALVATIQIATLLAVGAPLVAIIQPLMPPMFGIALLVIIPILLGIALWRTTADLQGHVRAAAEVIVSAIGRHSSKGAAGEGERALERAYHLLPGLGEPFPVRIRESDPAVGLRLSQLGLRGRTGATIVAISRGEEVVLVPDGHEVLHAGDVIALAGTREAIEAARQLLATPRGAAASPLAGSIEGSGPAPNDVS